MHVRSLLSPVPEAIALLVLALVATGLPNGRIVAADEHRPISEAPDELDADEDNADPQSKEACQDVRSDAGSLVIRRLVDGPRQADGSLAFVSGVCIYLPPGYEDGKLRYPVLYLLHGAFGWQEDWFVQGDAQATMDALYAADPANALIVVAPDGTYGADWKDDPSGYPANETYVIDHVIGYVDTYLRTIPDRRGRAMSGLSNGGAGTLRLSALHPDAFSVVTAMSAATPVNLAVDRTNIREVANDPTEMADNLELVDLAMVYGLFCGDADAPEACATYGFAWGFENACCNTEHYRLRLEEVRDRPYTYERVAGAHDWHYWTAWLREPHGPFILDHLMDPRPVAAPLAPLEAPESFDHRSIKPDVEVYDYTFANDAERAAEFLTLTDVSADGLTVRGSGTLAVTTAARYVPGETYTVSGHDDGEPVAVIADGEGRLAFAVDLGPAHTEDEGTIAQRAEEASAGGGYWRTRHVEIGA